MTVLLLLSLLSVARQSIALLSAITPGPCMQSFKALKVYSRLYPISPL